MKPSDTSGHPANALRRQGPTPAHKDLDVSIGDTFLVFVEGDVTERLYLEGVRQRMAIGTVQVRVIRPTHHDPLGLVNEAIRGRDEHGLPRRPGLVGMRAPHSYDHVWVVFDTEAPDGSNRVAEAMKLANRHGIRCACSTPSIEYWLLLHFRYTIQSLLDAAAAGRAVGDAWGREYNKSQGIFAQLWRDLSPRISTAVGHARRARRHHESVSATAPANPSTQVDLLVEALNASVQPPKRLLGARGAG